MEVYEANQTANWSSGGEGGRDKMSTDQYCLRWNSYETNILATFEGLLDSEALSDVTLFCEGESFKAHRIVLAACSTHFAKIFSTAPLNSQLIVILDGTRCQDLQILLQFMYRGVAFLPSDRIESVLRTGEVLQVKGLFNSEGVQRGANGERSGQNNRAWSPVNDNQKGNKDLDSLVGVRERRDSSSPVPTGRIAVPQPPPVPDSPLPHTSLPLFTQPPAVSAYSRPGPAFPTISSLYSHPGFGGFRHDLPPTSKSLNFTPTSSGGNNGIGKAGGGAGNNDLTASPPSSSSRQTGGGSGERNTPVNYKFSPQQVRGDRDREPESYETVVSRGGQKPDPSDPHGNDAGDDLRLAIPMRRPSSEQYDLDSPPNSRPKLMTPSGSDSLSAGVGKSGGGGNATSSGGGGLDGGRSSSSPGPGGARMPFDPERIRLKTERPSTPPSAPIGGRKSNFSSSDYSREGLSRLSSQSLPITRTDGAEDLRTNDTEERIKRENNLETLRRIAQANAQVSGNNGPSVADREKQLATIQKMDLIRQASLTRDHFLGGRGGFSAPLTAPLGIPASELARIAQTVPDPGSGGPGEPTSGTGTKLKCPFCERTYGYETNLRAHIRQRHQGIRVPCPFCHRSFTRNNTVRRHIAREHRHQVNPKFMPSKFGQTKVLGGADLLPTSSAGPGYGTDALLGAREDQQMSGGGQPTPPTSSQP